MIKLVLLALAIAMASVIVAQLLCPVLSTVVIVLGLWVVFECCGLAHWFVGLHPESVRIHYNLLWTQN